MGDDRQHGTGRGALHIAHSTTRERKTEGYFSGCPIYTATRSRKVGFRSYGQARDALEGRGPQSWPQKRLGRRLEEVAEAVGGGNCRPQMPLRLALAVRGAVAGHRLGALERGGGGGSLPSNASLGQAFVRLRACSLSVAGQVLPVAARGRWRPTPATGRRRCHRRVTRAPGPCAGGMRAHPAVGSRLTRPVRRSWARAAGGASGGRCSSRPAGSPRRAPTRRTAGGPAPRAPCSSGRNSRCSRRGASRC